MILNLPNFLSLLRAPLALVFLSTDITYRTIALIAAAITDGLDGWIARRWGISSKFGALLDPVMDKFFVLFILAIFYGEGHLTLWEGAAFLCRDFSVLLYGLYLLIRGQLMTYKFHAIYCGKATTIVQYAALLTLTLGYAVPEGVYAILIFLGLMSLVKLAITGQKYASSDKPS